MTCSDFEKTCTLETNVCVTLELVPYRKPRVYVNSNKKYHTCWSFLQITSYAVFNKRPEHHLRHLAVVLKAYVVNSSTSKVK